MVKRRASAGQLETKWAKQSKPVQNPVKSDTPAKIGRSLLEVSSLPASVTNDELSKLFGKLGTLSRCNVLYDAKGISKVD